MDPMVFQFIGSTVTNATDSFVTPAASQLIFALQMISVTGVTLYIVLTGYMISTGAIEAPIWEFVKRSAKIIIIAGFALTVNGYTQGVMDAMNGLETGLAAAMNTTNASPAQSVYQVLDHSLGTGLDVVAQCFQRAQQAGFSIGAAIGWAIAGLVVGIGTVLISGLGGAVVIVAKFALSIVFALGPLFIMALMFPLTSRFFDSWIGQALNHIFTIVIMAVIMTFASNSYDVFVGNADFSQPNINPMYVALQIAALTGVLAWIIMQAGSIASGIAGGFSMAAMGIRHLATPVTGGLGAARSLGDIANPMSTRRDLESGHMVTARRANHLLAGNTALNPAYRQHFLESIGKNWGRGTGGKIQQ